MSDYEKLKQELEALRNKCKELEDKIEQAEQSDEPKFERVPDGKQYFTLSAVNGAFVDNRTAEGHWQIDDNRFDNNNYYKTKERAQEVADKINFLLKLERFHDIYCPDYVPDYDNDNFSSNKYTIFYDHTEKIYEVFCLRSTCHRTLVYFPSEEIAQKVCDILNKENKQSTCDD